MLPVVQWGAGGNMGSGDQYWSWISKEDAASAFIWLALNPACTGPYNFTGGAETNRQFTQTLASLLNRPALLPAPSFALKLVLGEMADSLLLASTNASNRKLLDSGYEFRCSSLKDAISYILGLNS
jgi:NAD dependent epimerase/dehydratase family enzyme